jgi:hypothetical protein
VSWFAAFPNIGPDGHVGRLSIRDQNSRSRFNRDLSAFPAMIDPSMAPIEVPMTQSGSIPACGVSKRQSTRHSTNPIFYLSLSKLGRNVGCARPDWRSTLIPGFKLMKGIPRSALS